MTIELDCSMGEGGGSVVRVSMALAAGQRKDLRLYNIRANRSKPGLRAQHIQAISAIKQFSGMSTPDLFLGCTDLTLSKKNNEKNIANVKIGTAGSIGLVTQAVSFYSYTQERELELRIKGGATHGKWAPSIEYLQYVTNEFARMMGKNISLSASRYGFFPKGGAEVKVRFESHKDLVPLTMIERGELEKIEIYSIVSKNLAERRVAERQIESFVKNIKTGAEIVKKPQYIDSFSAGTGLTIIDYYSSGSRMGCFLPGERNLTSERVGEICASLWKKRLNSSASVDEFAADQLIVPMALTAGKSEITTTEITNHTKTNIDLVKKFINRDIQYKKEDNHYKITVN
jgi:RNA 3'-phosphate cyclase